MSVCGKLKYCQVLVPVKFPGKCYLWCSTQTHSHLHFIKVGPSSEEKGSDTFAFEDSLLSRNVGRGEMIIDDEITIKVYDSRLEIRHK